MKRNQFGAGLTVLALAAAMVSACGGDTQAQGCSGRPTVKASGSTAQANAMTRFAKAFEHDCAGHSLNYTANGSGAGISEFLGGQTDFAGSDSPLSKVEYGRAQQRCGSPVWNLPVVFGPIAIAYHLGGVPALNLDGPTAARVFNGAITHWNDPAIAALNAGVALPAEPIRVVFRSDQSGTSDNFQRYLDTAGGDAWGRGAGKVFNGGVGEGAAGSDGVAAAVANAEGSVTYVEWSFALAQHLSVAKVITSAGPDPVGIDPASVGKTISSAWFMREGNDLAFDTISFYRPNQTGAYPIVLATYEIVCSKYPDAQVGAAVKAFLHSATGAGQTGLADNGYAPVPEEFRPRLTAAIDAVS
ncbi:phosphate ABC transporter substrate-binding protein PstS [Mycobacterium gordonae]|uniref:Phosphate-binding protein n=1 Tax=Mycobacterium gordonae TaxID=1778 RepID=A0A1X1XBK4_MYCGO|nr:phosphate ABC transporter substrate-binding protein PstS [Mycobacterium gordonae]MCV7009901.1 phosphate ABC transporter substrate-binding protein PstS [Mycobacterium gordonae]ODR22063.1 phosphate ABC transporter substrate-binding protein PstS [Mycobacterium gordonae]ORV96199.1 phosphate-binding protein [Mycobacterium gordonae]